MSWRAEARPARLEERLDGDRVRCHLSPRNCEIAPGKLGFCGVRGNAGGRLVTFNYGRGVHPTEETIETEAVNHYAPGERILSVGNVGCMLHCDYCHNWKTSQARHVDDRDVHAFTPREIVAKAERLGIRMLSWTYNDPVVWHEFVLDTARLARERGLRNLYKSAFYISPRAVDELLPLIDVFSLSIKTIDPDVYRRVTKGRLEPVLEATKQVFRAGKHLEVSCLMVTDLTDDEETARGVAGWVARELSPDVPVHFVRFHPDYRMTDRGRTPVERLHRAREIARSMGLRHVYLGNVHDPEASSTRCLGCDALLVERFGLAARVVGILPDGRCASCSAPSGVTLLPAAAPPPRATHAPLGEVKRFDWRGDIRSVHVEARNASDAHAQVCWRRRRDAEDADAPSSGWHVVALARGERHRWLVAQSAADEAGVEAIFPPGVASNLHEVFDRAHFPTIPVEEACAGDDLVPLPHFRARRREG